jgi:hypothetical protein
MSKDIKVFVGSCFHCIASAPGETTPRPRGEDLHASKTNEVSHFDHLYMGPSVDDAKYVLIVKDDYSNYVLLKQCKNADADSAAAVLIEWFAAFWCGSAMGFRPRQSLQEHRDGGHVEATWH